MMQILQLLSSNNQYCLMPEAADDCVIAYNQSPRQASIYDQDISNLSPVYGQPTLSLSSTLGYGVIETQLTPGSISHI